ncbi:hypothetical protein ACWCQN_47690 [Streptomyces sp. NPDC001984]
MVLSLVTALVRNLVAAPAAVLRSRVAKDAVRAEYCIYAGNRPDSTSSSRA